MLDFGYDMTDVCNLIGISIPPLRGGGFSTSCPNCGPNKNHLNINIQNSVFKCWHCGWSGGMLDLYCYYTGLSTRKEANKDIKEKLNLNEKAVVIKRKAQVEERASSFKTVDMADISKRNIAYRKLLSCLSLQEEHRKNLIDRGLTDEHINNNMYRSSKIPYMDLVSTIGFEPVGVPGFYKENGTWKFVKLKKGILIPVRDTQNRIQGMQLRVDESERIINHTYSKKNVVLKERFNNYGKKKGYYVYKGEEIVEEIDSYTETETAYKTIRKTPKYVWISSSGREGGASSSTFIHCSSLFAKKDGKIVPYIPGKKIVITEGPLKGDIFSSLSGVTTLCVPGVNCTHYLESAVRDCINAGCTTVYMAYDMDYTTNPNVKRWLNDTVIKLNKTGLEVGWLQWNSEYKGIDDYYLAKIKKTT